MLQPRTQEELREQFKEIEGKPVLKNCEEFDVEYTTEYVNWLEKLVLSNTFSF